MKKYLCMPLILAMATLTSLVAQESVKFIPNDTLQKVKTELLQKYGAEQQFRIERGVEQAAALWRSEDGSPEEFAEYCRQYFVAEPAALAAVFKKLEFYNEVLGGHFNEMRLDKDQPIDLDWGEITPLDIAMNQFNPGAHISEDLFKNKIAFFPLLNFPVYSLAEKTSLGPTWNRQQWAYARAGGSNNTRLPADVIQKISTLMAGANLYISEYNIFMGSLIDKNMQTQFPADMKLISHWGIRDELKARYADKQGLFKQQLIYKVMERIINQDIPSVMVNSGKYQWNPLTNKVYDQGKEIPAVPEADDRYKNLLSTFQAMRLIDPFSPLYPSHISRSFDTGREIQEKDIEALFVEVLASTQAREVARLIQKRLGRKLQPFDIWYPGFKSSASLAEEELDKIVAKKYPDFEAFEKDIHSILIDLGFSPESAAFIAPKIQVDPARGSGHNAQTQSRLFKSRLRTRIPANGMNYKGYNIAMHELGHAVENVIDLYKIDYVMLAGVPNTAFTEALAYVFQDRSIAHLGITIEDKQAGELLALESFWNAYEIMGVSLVDMKTWHWMYEHPQATPAELKKAVSAIAKDTWNKYYAKAFGVRDQAILAIYSHMIDSTLYLPDYAIGHIIQFQMEEYLRGKKIGPEMERMCLAGSILPQLWMKNAVGVGISAKPLLQAVSRALRIVKK